ncbi:MAG: hypothetical protein J6D21_09695 [Clostridia bacterium]|nr:hypothetical protein [Clostridia bacterium]
MYKTELHCHCNEASQCAKISAEHLAKRYREAGYTTVVLTNHFAPFTYRYLECTHWQEWIDRYLYAVERVREASRGELNVLLGAEVRLNNNPNDFLLYGVTEEFLRQNEDLYNHSIEELYPMAKENGILVIQAHPFRNHMRITPPDWIDGIEVYNGSAGGYYGTDSRNDVAEFWANKFPRIRTSGTDLHYPEDAINAGIVTEAPITTREELVATLKGGNYQWIKGGEVYGHTD